MLNTENPSQFNFPKKQRLTHKKQIEKLFTEGIAAKNYPFRIKFKINELAYHRILIAVPKRNVSLSCNRNEIKRLMREAFRLNQHQLSTSPHHVDLLFIFTGKQKLTYVEVENKLLKLLEKINLETAKERKKLIK